MCVFSNCKPARIDFPPDRGEIKDSDFDERQPAIAIWPSKPEVLISQKTITDSIEIPTTDLEFLSRDAMLSAVVPQYVVCLSVRLSVCDVQVRMLEYFENNFTAE